MKNLYDNGSVVKKITLKNFKDLENYVLGFIKYTFQYNDNFTIEAPMLKKKTKICFEILDTK